MKATQHKTTMRDVLTFLLDGPQTAENIGAHFWPDKIGYGSMNWGPVSVAVSASYLLGKMRKRGFVYQSPWPASKWSITNSGRDHLEKTGGA